MQEVYNLTLHRKLLKWVGGIKYKMNVGWVEA